MIKNIVPRICLLITAIFSANNSLTIDFNSLLATNNSHLVSCKLKPVYYTAWGLKKIHNVTGDFAVGLRLPNQTTINPSHLHSPSSIATKTGHMMGDVLRYSIKRTAIPFALSYLHREATNMVFNYIFFECLPDNGFWAGFDYRTLFPNLIYSYVMLAAGIGTAYWLTKDGIDLCSKLLVKDHRIFAETYSSQPNSREYNSQQIHELEYFINKHNQEPAKVAKIKSMLINEKNDLGPSFKNTSLSYSQRLAHCSILKAAIRNRQHTLAKIIKFFGKDTITVAHTAGKHFNIENCMICHEEMNNHKDLTDFSCNFHSIHQECFDNAQEHYYKGKSDPDKRRCLVCT